MSSRPVRALAVAGLLLSVVAVAGPVDATPQIGLRSDAPRTLAQLPVDPAASDIASMLRHRGERHVRVRPALGRETASAQALPSNAFSVRSYWADYTDGKGRKHVVLYGSWNFRNNFVGSGSPKDISAVAVTGFSSACWTQVSDAVVYKDYKGKVRGHGTRYSASHGKTIRSIADRTKNHMLLSDNGVHEVDMRKDKKKKCGGRKAGSYYFEHNQSGGGWSASVSMALLSVSYSNSNALTLRKAAKYNYYN